MGDWEEKMRDILATYTSPSVEVLVRKSELTWMWGTGKSYRSLSAAQLCHGYAVFVIDHSDEISPLFPRAALCKHLSQENEAWLWGHTIMACLQRILLSSLSKSIWKQGVKPSSCGKPVRQREVDLWSLQANWYEWYLEVVVWDSESIHDPLWNHGCAELLPNTAEDIGMRDQKPANRSA